jgi:hypothetical protein
VKYWNTEILTPPFGDFDRYLQKIKYYANWRFTLGGIGGKQWNILIILNFFLILSDKKMETLQVFIKTELEDDMEENVVENSHLLPRETPCQEPIKSER